MPLPADSPAEPRSDQLPRTDVVTAAPNKTAGAAPGGSPTARGADDAPAPALADDFELLAELGEGAQGRVFLARQCSLGDRPVVVKITSCQGREHLSLARLQHTHIVPLYWARDDPSIDRRTLCMPYFGSVTIAALLLELRAKPPGDRTGQDVLDVLDRARSVAGVELPGRGPARLALARATYAQAVAWMGSCLADALQYAHERGLVHLDLKPGNVLLAADAQPMLLDFHLAHAPVRPDGPPPRNLGGTPHYMSPEQRLALAALVEGTPPREAVDGRSDLYSLGIILYQALGGPVPLPADRPPRLNGINPQVSVGLADIIHKCLGVEPSLRYPDAAELAADLRRHLADQPLRGVPNRSWREHWQKWRRRRPQALMVCMLIGILVAGAAAAGGYYRQLRRTEAVDRLAGAAKSLRDGLEHLRDNDLARAVEQFEAGLALAQDTPGAGDVERQTEAALKVARRAQKAAEFRKLVDRMRHDVLKDSLSTKERESLSESCRKLWQGRSRVLALPEAGQTDEFDRRLRADLLDLAVLWTDLRIAGRKGDDLAAEQADALRVLSEAEKLGAVESRVLLEQRYALATALGRADVARAADERRALVLPRTSWDHTALGRRLLGSDKPDDLEKAARHFEDAVAIDPRGFWPAFYQGIFAFRRGKYHEAYAAFRACTVAVPQSSRAYYNRALALEKLDDAKRALADYDQALKLEPDFAQAALNRGLLLHNHKLGKPAQVLADLRYALEKCKGADKAAAHYALAFVQRSTDRAAALEHLEQALLANPKHEAARDLLDELERKK